MKHKTVSAITTAIHGCPRVVEAKEWDTECSLADVEGVLTTSPGYDDSGEWRPELAVPVSALEVDGATAVAFEVGRASLVVAVFDAEIVWTELNWNRSGKI